MDISKLSVKGFEPFVIENNLLAIQTHMREAAKRLITAITAKHDPK